jgi:hypothetical protein
MCLSFLPDVMHSGSRPPRESLSYSSSCRKTFSRCWICVMQVSCQMPTTVNWLRGDLFKGYFHMLLHAASPVDACGQEHDLPWDA